MTSKINNKNELPRNWFATISLSRVCAAHLLTIRALKGFRRQHTHLPGASQYTVRLPIMAQDARMDMAISSWERVHAVRLLFRTDPMYFLQ
jgi:hypothetical protein